MEVTEALEIMPLSIRFKLVNTPPMVQSLRSIFHFNLFSLSDALGSSSIDLLLSSILLPPSEVDDIRKEDAMVLYEYNKSLRKVDGKRNQNEYEYICI